MNLSDMTPHDWLMFGIVIVLLAIPSIIKPFSLWLGKRLHLVKANASEEALNPMQVVGVPGQKDGHDGLATGSNGSEGGSSEAQSAEDGSAEGCASAPVEGDAKEEKKPE